MVLKGKTKEQVEAEKLSQAKSVAVSAINAHKEVLFKRGFAFDGEQYPLDIGAQVAYQALQTAISTGMQTNAFVITVDNKTIEMGVETFGRFSAQALQRASEIVINARAVKDRILVSNSIDAVQSLQKEFCE